MQACRKERWLHAGHVALRGIHACTPDRLNAASWPGSPSVHGRRNSGQSRGLQTRPPAPQRMHAGAAEGPNGCRLATQPLMTHTHVYGIGHLCCRLAHQSPGTRMQLCRRDPSVAAGPRHLGTSRGALQCTRPSWTTLADCTVKTPGACAMDGATMALVPFRGARRCHHLPMPVA